MIKIVVTGERGSGVTSYFYGVLHMMQRGISGFSLRANDSDAYRILHSGILRLRDTSLPVEERWPSPCEKPVDCEQEILYDFQVLETVRWVEYMPEQIYEYLPHLPYDVGCLFVCINGSLLQSSEAKLEEVADDFYDSFGADLCDALLRTEEKCLETITPVCILLTQFDKVSPKLQDMSLITKFVKRCLPILFQEDGGPDRMVAVCPVSLGEDIDDGGKLRPKNVEKPLFFALLSALSAMQNQTESIYKEMVTNRQRHQEFLEKYHLLFLNAIWPPKPSLDHGEELKRMLSIIQELKNKLLSVNQDIPLFVNGKQQNWNDYFA